MRRVPPELWIFIFGIITLIVGPFVIGLIIYKSINLVRQLNDKEKINEPFFGIFGVGLVAVFATIYIFYLCNVFWFLE